jgi:phosphoribosyl-ATP pyrophosphohydrolase
MTENDRKAQMERFVLLNEESGETVHALSKIFRHGIDEWYGQNANNRALLMNEVGDVLFCIAFLVARGDISPEYIYAAMLEKKSKVNQFLHHNFIEFGEIEAAFAKIKGPEAE